MSDISSRLPMLILLPGMDGTGELFGDFVRDLPHGFETIAVRYPGDRRLACSRLLQVVQAACSATERYVLVAESYSAPLAILFAASNPPNLAGLVLCAGFASSPVQGWRRLVCELLAPIAFRVPIPGFATRWWLVGPGAPRSLVANVRAAIASVHPEVMAARTREALACDVRGELAQVAAPILYIRANQDRVVSAACSDEVRRISPMVEFAEIDGPHLLLQREPRRAADAVASFVRRLG
jgi:pimeloyl-[acyl-carrier protein] methyl ester esterase